MTMFRVGDLVAVVHHNPVFCAACMIRSSGAKTPPVGTPQKVVAVTLKRHSSGLIPNCGQCQTLTFADGSVAVNHRCRRLAKSDDTAQTETYDFRKELTHVPHHA